MIVLGIVLLILAAITMFVGVGGACHRGSSRLQFLGGLGIDLFGLWIAWYG